MRNGGKVNKSKYSIATSSNYTPAYKAGLTPWPYWGRSFR